jgi:rhodanese-related sulfurtransferase
MNPTLNKSKNSIPWLIAVVIIIGVILAAIFLFSNKKPADGKALPTEISVQDAAQRQMDGALILDVREPTEWSQGHVKGAKLIPLGELQNRMNELPTDQDILIICHSGNRSAQARDILRAAGMTRTTSISGGFTQWIAAGLPYVTEK